MYFDTYYNGHFIGAGDDGEEGADAPEVTMSLSKEGVEVTFLQRTI